MAETAPTAAPAVEIDSKKKQPQKASSAKKTAKLSGPSVSELLVKAVSASKERSRVSLAALKKALTATGYDVEKNNSRLKLALKGLVAKETLVQVKGSGASGSFKLNKKQAESKDKAAKPKKAPAKVKKPVPKKATKSPVKAKKVAAQSPKKAKKPAASAKKSPKKVKASKPKKAVKSPSKKATKSPAKKAAKSRAAKSPAKAKKAAPKKK
ncbi:histone H1B-like [Pelobates cultripes]|uniref:Histone H1B-like n=1 Tax=Pelobates cultripes TaxID=61616 RepID=A0AAD1RKD5_PELCU|nr:histone H1B-like [Pelobates cultripes]